MAVTPKNWLRHRKLTASAATYYTATNVTARIDNFTLTNTDSSARTVDVHIIAPAGSATAANKIIDAKSISAHETYMPGNDRKIYPVRLFHPGAGEYGYSRDD